MGGLAITTVRRGVQFVPQAAAAFRRADAQVLRELGRHIDVNSTYRSWADQMKMFTDWNRYVAGIGPYPGHSKAIHPNSSRHVWGLALDSDDWRNARIVEILAENGFIRNQLHVPNEQHHFEYIRSRDKNYGKPASGGVAIPAPAPAPEPEPVIPEEEEDDMPKNTGLLYRAPMAEPKDKQREYLLILNTGSGYQGEISSGLGGEIEADRRREFANAFDTTSIIRVNEAEATAFKAGLPTIRPRA